MMISLAQHISPLFFLIPMGLCAQSLPVEVHFPASDTLVWKMSMSMHTQGADILSGEKIDMVVGADFKLSLYDARIEDDTIVTAQGRISEQKMFRKELTTPKLDNFPDTSHSNAVHGLERYPLRFHFNQLGHLQQIALADCTQAREDPYEESMEAASSLLMYDDLFKSVFMGLRIDGRPSIGDEWQIVETTTTGESGKEVITRMPITWKYERAVDTLGHSVGVVRCVADRLLMTDAEGKHVEPSWNSLQSYALHGVFYVDLNSGLPVYAAIRSIADLTSDAGNGGVSSKKKGKKEKKLPTASTMRMTIETEAVMRE